MKSDFHLPKIFVVCFIESLLKMITNIFYFILKALFVLKIFKFLPWLFGCVGKTAWLERQGWLQNPWRCSLVNKHLQYTYSPIFQKVKPTRGWNLVNQYDITREIFFFENYDENEPGGVVPDFFLLFCSVQLSFNMIQ